MRRILISLCALLCSTPLLAHEPLYVVNGKVVENIDDVPQDNIANIDILPANEETIAEWGTEASEGVILITLVYDTPAHYNAEGYDSFTAYLANKVKWEAKMPAARVSLRLAIDASGKATISEVLQSTSRQFLKRVERAIAEAPAWQPAIRNGEPTSSIELVNLQLPEGKRLPVEYAVILR